MKDLNIGILGGTFDPIHLGHLFIAEWVKTELRLDKIIFIPAGIPPHKNHVKACKTNRLDMVNLAISDNKNFEILSMEMDYNEISYTVNTLKKLVSQGWKKLNFIIGADSLLEIQTWYNYKEIMNLSNLVVVPRGTIDISILKSWTKKNIPEFLNNIIFIDIPVINISSTIIRDRVKKQLSIRYMVPDKILFYIKENNLYK